MAHRLQRWAGKGLLRTAFIAAAHARDRYFNSSNISALCSDFEERNSNDRSTYLSIFA